MRIFQRFSVLIAVILLASCGTPYYISSNFEQLTADHKTVAIIPFEMIYSGQMPKNMTDDHITKITAAESKAFQIAFFNLLLKSTKQGKKAMRVDVQHFDKTNKLLADNNIPYSDLTAIDAEELCRMLGVDAVVKCRVEKHRFMSDLASYGIDIGIDLVNILTDYAVWPFIPGGLSTSKEVRSSYSLLDNKAGTTLWSTSDQTEADWSRASNELIESIISKSVKKFPYRIK